MLDEDRPTCTMHRQSLRPLLRARYSKQDPLAPMQLFRLSLLSGKQFIPIARLLCAPRVSRDYLMAISDDSVQHSFAKSEVEAADRRVRLDRHRLLHVVRS